MSLLPISQDLMVLFKEGNRIESWLRLKWTNIEISCDVNICCSPSFVTNIPTEETKVKGKLNAIKILLHT